MAQWWPAAANAPISPSDVLPDLVQVTDDKTFTYSYASDEDTVGRPVVTNGPEANTSNQ